MVFQKVTLDIMSETIIKIIKPSLRATLVTLLVSIMSSVVMLSKHRAGSFWPWLLLSVVFAVAFLYFLGVRYIITRSRSDSDSSSDSDPSSDSDSSSDSSSDSQLSQSFLLTKTTWWGFGKPQVITLAAVDNIEIIRSRGISSLVGFNIYVNSSLPSEGSVNLLFQVNPENIISELSKLSNILNNNYKIKNNPDNDIKDKNNY
jgi:hypothetical protein